MIVSILPSIYDKAIQGDQRILKVVTDIFQMVLEGRHQLVLEGDSSLVNLIESPEFIDYKDIIREVKNIDKAPHRYNLIVRVTDNTDVIDGIQFFNGLKVVKTEGEVRYEYLHVDWIINYLSDSLSIYVENANNDGLFIRAIYYLLKGHKLKSDLVDFRGSGGIGNMAEQLERIDMPKRVICITDSDKRYPNDSGNLRYIKEIREVCRSKDFYYHILDKRAIENYIPDYLLEIEYGGKSHPYFQMGKNERKYFNIKKGLTPQDFKTKNIRELYSSYLKGRYAQKSRLPGFGRVAKKLFRRLYEDCQMVSPAPEDLLDDETIKELKDITNLIDNYL